MDIKTVSAYRRLEQLAIKQSKERAFLSDSVHKKDIGESPVPTTTEPSQPTTKTKGLDYYA